MQSISHALSSARKAIEHPQCGETVQRQVATDMRPFGDEQALAVVLAIQHHPDTNSGQKGEAAELLATWEAKCGSWHRGHLNVHNATPQLPQNYREWQPYLDAALLSRD